MYDKTVRRRRAVLGLLVAGSLILLTAYFGEARGGPLHGVQRGASEVLNPIQDGGSRALKPVRDLFGWFGDTLEAKGDVEDLRAERNRLRTEVVRGQAAVQENVRLKKLVELNATLGLDAFGPLTSRVIAQSPTVWYATIRINKGTSDGVREGYPVMNEEALIGTVTDAFSGYSQVTLITDSTARVSVRVGDQRLVGVTTPASAGNPNDLIAEYVRTDVVKEGDRVETAGKLSDPDLKNLYPPSLPVGEVSRIDNAGTDTEEIHLRPYAEMRDLDFVQVLTRPQGEDSDP